MRVKPGDTLRSNATYDTEIQSTYENMGIAVALLAPDTPDGKPTAPGSTRSRRRRTARRPASRAGSRPSGRRSATSGVVTHGHCAENGNHGGAQGEWNAAAGAPTNDVAIANFLYAPGDLSHDRDERRCRP